MQVTELDLVSPKDAQGFLEANSEMLEKLAVMSLINLMRSDTAVASDKLAAAKTALEAIGKSKPLQAANQTTNNIQINTAIAPHLMKALSGLGDTLTLLGKVNDPD